MKRYTLLFSSFLIGLAACSSTTTSDPSVAPIGSAPSNDPSQPAPPPTPDPASPTPPASNVTMVRVHYAGNPGTMTLRGSANGLSWDTSAPLAASGNTFTWTAKDLTTDTELKPMLGDTWSRGPNYKVKPGETLDIYPHFVKTKGTVEKKYPSFVSTKLPSTRGIWIYLPPTYLENTESRLGVLYMHDGQNLFDPSTAFGGNEWMVDETMDAGSEDGSIREVIVVGVENTAARIDELTPSNDPGYGGGDADKYLSMMTDEIKPLIDQTFRTVPARESTGIMGSSLGGLVSAYAGVHLSSTFGLVGEMSPSTWWDSKMIIGQVATTGATRPIRVYVDSGDASDDTANTNELVQKYETIGYVENTNLLHVVQAGGQHNEIYWSQRLPAALHFLLSAR